MSIRIRLLQKWGNFAVGEEGTFDEGKGGRLIAQGIAELVVPVVEPEPAPDPAPEPEVVEEEVVVEEATAEPVAEVADAPHARRRGRPRKTE
jgi:hypothetical protein